MSASPAVCLSVCVVITSDTAQTEPPCAMTLVNHATVLHSAAAAIFHLPRHAEKSDLIKFIKTRRNIYTFHPSATQTCA